MKVVVLFQSLAPRMQSHGNRELGTEVLGIEGEATERAGGDAKEQAEENAAVDADERVERMRQGEDVVEVRHRQQHRLLGGHPLRPLLALTFRAVTVAAGVVRDAAMRAVRTLLDVPAERRRAATDDGAPHLLIAELVRRLPVVLRQSLRPLQVRLDRARREVAHVPLDWARDRHVVHHLIP